MPETSMRRALTFVVLVGCTPVGPGHAAAQSGAFEPVAEHLARLPRPIPTTVDALFPKDHVALPPQFEALELDATYDGTQQVKIEVAGVDASASIGMNYIHPIPQFRVTLDVDPEQLEDRISDRWGPPFGMSDRSSNPVWIDADARLRVELDGGWVTYSRYVPLQALLGDAPGEFPFEHEPLLGAKRSDFVSAYRPSMHGDPDEREALFLDLPQTELSDGETSVLVLFDEDERAVSVTLFAGFERRRDANAVLVNPLLERWGDGERDGFLTTNKIWRTDTEVTLRSIGRDYQVTKSVTRRRVPRHLGARRHRPRVRRPSHG